MEENNSLPTERQEGKPRFGKILRTKSYRWIFYVALMIFGIILALQLTWTLLDVLDKFPEDYMDPGWDNYVKWSQLLPVLFSFLNAAALILLGFGCWFVGIVDYTLPPNVRRGFIFGITIFIIAYQFFHYFGGIFGILF